VRVGNFEIHPVKDGEFTLPARIFFPKTSEEDWAPHKRFLEGDGMLRCPVGGFAITGDGRVTLVDIGAGPSSTWENFSGALLESLAALHIEPDDVTDVLFSHLHFDHIGWASTEGRAVFPNATYRCHVQDWHHFMTQNTHQGQMAEAVGLPVYASELLDCCNDRFQTWDADGTVLPGIDVRHAPGHTPGSSIVVVSSGAERALLLGDAVHCPAELLESEWEMIGDVDGELAKRTREALAKEFEGTDVPLAAPHFPDMQFGRLLRAEGRLGWVFD
jgi:glyoxylase-like metal-dependent hydrolase (beta-lactamase superfamily II)